MLFVLSALLAGFLESCHLQQERYGTLQAAAAGLAAGQAAEADPDDDEPGGAGQVLSGVPARVAAHSFMQSFMAYCAVYTDRTSLAGLGVGDNLNDPLAACPICADVPGEIHAVFLHV